MSGEYKKFNENAKYDDIPKVFRERAVDKLIAVKEYWYAVDKEGKPTTEKVVDSEVVRPLAMQLWKNDPRVSGGRRTRRRRRRARTNRRR
jgi:hypothetical protein